MTPIIIMINQITWSTTITTFLHAIIYNHQDQGISFLQMVANSCPVSGVAYRVHDSSAYTAVDSASVGYSTQKCVPKNAHKYLEL